MAISAARLARRTSALAAVGSCLLLAKVPWAEAQTSNPGQGLNGLSFANDVERSAAVANQQVFDTLDPRCNPGGVLDSIPEPLNAPPGANCTSDQFFVYLNARELVNTANEIHGEGASAASLGQNIEGLGKALRWTAAEEFAVQSSMATEFSNNQLASMAARMSALRYGAGGFAIANRVSWPLDGSPLYAALQPPDESTSGSEVSPGSGAVPAGDSRESFSPWGGFINASFGYGNKLPTPLEDAFDFDGSEVTLGVDYRYPNNLVLGGVLGLTRQDVDFDEAASPISVVDGSAEAEGRSLIVFAMMQGERLHVSGSIGLQTIDYRFAREIKYPSFNPDLPSANSLANSRPDSDVTTATFGFGYSFGQRRFLLEPIINLQYLDVSIDAFAEERSINRLSNSGESKRFDLSVSSQSFESLEIAAGARMQYVFTPRIGVVIPYLSIETRRELQDESRIIQAAYAAIADIPGIGAFAVPTDAPDDSYTVASLGLSMVLRGGRQRQLDGPIAGGLSAFLQFNSIGGLRYYDDTVMTGGFRYEF